ncbi:MAG: hypothetical protein BWZ02_00500 [Lentisphaerae bacterium ADurb.BinA184]|nr:MAG: hypothetical protein BWZ02_00500 [Lentisphaerae bacterium ADurb.BinA184]
MRGLKRVGCVLGVCGAWLATFHANGDWIETANGSRLVGEVKGAADGKIRLQTDFAGEVTVSLSQVTAMEVATSLNWGLADGRLLTGAAAARDGVLTGTGEAGPAEANLAAVAAAWPPGEPNPLVAPPAPPPAWETEVILDMATKSGNSDRTSAGGGIRSLRKTDHDRLLLYGTFDYAEENDQETANTIAAGADYERNISDRLAWYVREELKHDELARLDFLSTTAAGLGYYFIKQDRHELRGRVGLLYRYESFEDGEDTSDIGLDLGLNHLYVLRDWAKLATSLTWTPSVSDFADYRLNHETSLELLPGADRNWSLRLGVANDYNSQPPDNTEKLDTTWFSHLVWKL